jgi:hypothetical protein
VRLRNLDAKRGYVQLIRLLHILTYIRSVFGEDDVDVVPVVRPGTQSQVARLSIERPRAQVQVTEHLELRRWYPQHLAVRVRDAVCVSIMVHHVARGAEHCRVT